MKTKQTKQTEPLTMSVVLVNGIPIPIFSNQHVVKNLMTGRDVIQDKDTPLACDVSMETYWSM